MNKNIRDIILSVSFIEGGAVMLMELLASKMVAPVFGTSLYVWTSVLGVTLIGLMFGYQIGGRLSNKVKNVEQSLYLVLILASFMMMLSIKVSQNVLINFIDYTPAFGSFCALMSFLFLPILLLGASSPLIVNLLASSENDAGEYSGKVYAISTLGGILVTLLLGFFLLESFGVKLNIVVYSFLLALIPIIQFLRNKKYLVLVVPFLLLIFSFNVLKEKKIRNSKYDILYETEGILGQLKVVDHKYYTQTRGVKNGRDLMVNNTGQTIMNKDNPNYSLWDYSYFFPAAASVKSKGSKALLLGLGGGTLLKQYQRLGFDVDVVEIDKRISEVAQEFFFVENEKGIIVDDARHYIKTTREKYDVVTFDLYLSETPPVHLLTVESFKDVQEILNPGGLLLINFYGFTTGTLGKASRSVYISLVESGFISKMLVTPTRDPNDEMGRNLIFIASDKEYDFSNNTYFEPEVPQVRNLEKYMINPDNLNLQHAELLYDDKNKLEIMYAPAAMEWRKAVNVMNTKPLIDERIPIFK